MDTITNKLNAIKWEYADKDPVALAELQKRIEETGKNFSLISYSDLVKGIEFHYPNINDGEAHRISNYEGWSGLDRRIIGDCLGYISMQSYIKAGFMASSLVVARLESKPSGIFFEWMKSLGALPDTKEDTILAFWTGQVKKSHQWYKYGKKI